MFPSTTLQGQAGIAQELKAIDPNKSGLPPICAVTFSVSWLEQEDEKDQKEGGRRKEGKEEDQGRSWKKH